MKHLHNLVYKLLLEEPQTGYGIAKQIQARTGWKPSWGSIYPLLEKGEEKGLLSVSQDGRSKKYQLTKKGRKHAQEKLAHLDKLYSGIIERMRIMQSITGEDMDIPIAYLEELKEGNDPFAAMKTELQKINKALYSLWKAQQIQKNTKAIKEILTKATQELLDLHD